MLKRAHDVTASGSPLDACTEDGAKRRPQVPFAGGAGVLI